MPGLYLLFLLLSIGGLAVLDYRFKLAIFYKPKQALYLLVAAVGIFIIWDSAGIAQHIFRIGQNDLLIGLRIGEFPLEELFFLILLNYSSLIVYCFLRRYAR